MKEKQRIAIHSIGAGLILLFVIIGGGFLIMHDPVWTLDDSTIIQSTVGSGRMMHVYDPPGYDLDAKSGRFFPLAYMHTNLVLLCTEGYISAKPLFVLNFVLWGGFVVLLFLLCYYVLKERLQSKALAEWISLIAVLVICQRVLYNFTVLWTTICIGNLLVVAFCFLFYKYCFGEGKKKWLFGVFSVMTLFYFSFCLESNVILPFAVGMGMVFAKNRKDFLAVSSFVIVLVFFALYGLLILPHVESFYDSSHGENVSIFSNAIRMILLQKLLIVMFIVVAWRFFRIVIKGDSFDSFSDTLLLAGVGLTLGSFVLKLNWGIYYLNSILLALPAMLKQLDFGTMRKGLVSGVILLGVFSYHVVKYPNMCKSIYDEKTISFQSMTHFNEALKYENTIVWYEDEANPDNQWKKCHVSRSLKHLKEDEDFEMRSIESMDKNVVVLMPNNTDITDLESMYADLSFDVKDEFAGLVSYQVIEK